MTLLSSLHVCVYDDLYAAKELTYVVADAESLQTSLREKDSHLVSLTENLVDQVWEDRPKRPANEVFPLDIKYSGTVSLSGVSLCC